MSKNIDYATENLLDYLYHQRYYELIGINFSRQASTSIPQQINSIEKLEKNDGTVIFFMTEKQQKYHSKFFLRYINCNRMM